MKSTFPLDMISGWFERFLCNPYGIRGKEQLFYSLDELERRYLELFFLHDRLNHRKQATQAWAKMAATREIGRVIFPYASDGDRLSKLLTDAAIEIRELQDELDKKYHLGGDEDHAD